MAGKANVNKKVKSSIHTITFNQNQRMLKNLNKKFPCRSETISELTQWIGDSNEPFPSCIYLFGHSGTGKTAIIKEILRKLSKNNNNFHTAHLNCVEAYTSKIFFEHILEELMVKNDDHVKCENLNEFVEYLRQMDLNGGYIIVLDSAERLRDMDANILPSLLRLQELTGLNICVVLISQLPFEKYYSKTGFSEVHTIYFPQYTKVETQRILSTDLVNVQRALRARLGRTEISENENTRRIEVVNTITLEFFNNYLNLFLSVFFKACRDVPELKLTARKCFEIYIDPVLDGSIEPSDVSRLWRHVAEPLRLALSQVYMRCDKQQDALISSDEHSNLLSVSVRKQAQSLELPYYAKYLLIAAFLASHNSAKQDKRLFVKHHGKQRKRMQSVNAKAKVSDKMSTSIGPKSFTIDRLLAIFYAILEEKVGLTCNLLSQISTLVHLKLLNFVSGENNIMEGSARLQCTVSLEFVLYIGKVVDFNVRQYLCDFM